MSQPTAPSFVPQGIPPAPQGIPQASQPLSASPFSNMPARGISTESTASQDVAPKSYSQVQLVYLKHCTRGCMQTPARHISKAGCVGTFNCLTPAHIFIRGVASPPNDLQGLHAACQSTALPWRWGFESAPACHQLCGDTVRSAIAADQTRQPQLVPAGSSRKYVTMQAAHLLSLLSGVLVRMQTSSLLQATAGCMTQLSQAVQQSLLTADGICSTSTAPQATGAAQSARERSPEQARSRSGKLPRGTLMGQCPS